MVSVMDVENASAMMDTSGKIVHVLRTIVLEMMKIKFVVAMGNVTPVPMICNPVAHVQTDGVMITDGQIVHVPHP